MKKITVILVLFISVIIHACFAQNVGMPPSDVAATPQTLNLYRNLFELAQKGYMIGHQDDLAYGVHWKYQKDCSDVKGVTGEYPAVFGWDLSGLESDKDKDIDGVPFKNLKQYVKQVYEMGGVNTFSWHAPSPLGQDKSAWDTTHGTVTSILPGGANHELFKTWLDKLASFLGSLKGSKGEAIPVLLRPFHELTGSWFWWGKNECSPFEFKTLWRFVVYYLQHEKKLHNILYVYNTAGDFKNEEEFLERYPGDDVADVISFDTYQYDDPQKSDWFLKNTNSLLRILADIAKEKNKLFALAETGYEQIPYAKWWTETLTKVIGDNKISYVLLWRNAGWNEWLKPPHMHYYIPFKGDVSAEDFVRFYNMPQTIFQKEVAGQKLYD